MPTNWRPLSRQAMRLVLDYLAMCNRKLEGDRYLFGKVTKHYKPAYAGGPLSVDTVENIFARAWEKLGLEALGSRAGPGTLPASEPRRTWPPKGITRWRSCRQGAGPVRGGDSLLS